MLLKLFVSRVVHLRTWPLLDEQSLWSKLYLLERRKADTTSYGLSAPYTHPFQRKQEDRHNTEHAELWPSIPDIVFLRTDTTCYIGGLKKELFWPQSIGPCAFKLTPIFHERRLFLHDLLLCYFLWWQQQSYLFENVLISVLYIIQRWLPWSIGFNWPH